MDTRTEIMNHEQVEWKIRRIAHEIYENHCDESDIYLVGITPRGSILASRLSELLKDISPLNIHDIELTINKNAPLSEPIIAEGLEAIRGNAVVLVDDVLNTGRALIYAASHLLSFEPSSMHTVCLIDRKHRQYPIRADYVGLTLATTLQEHISVEFGEVDAAYLD